MLRDISIHTCWGVFCIAVFFLSMFVGYEFVLRFVFDSFRVKHSLQIAVHFVFCLFGCAARGQNVAIA